MKTTKIPSVRLSRRQFVTASAVAVATVPLATLLAQRPSLAQEQLTEDDPTAQALGYVNDAGATDNAAREPDANCANCQLYMTDQGADGWAPCSIFGNKLVKGEGWCTVWQPKA